MQFWAIIFFILALVAGSFGFGLIPTATAAVAQILTFTFLGFAILAFVLRYIDG